MITFVEHFFLNVLNYECFHLVCGGLLAAELLTSSSIWLSGMMGSSINVLLRSNMCPSFGCQDTSVLNPHAQSETESAFHLTDKCTHRSTEQNKSEQKEAHHFQAHPLTHFDGHSNVLLLIADSFNGMSLHQRKYSSIVIFIHFIHDKTEANKRVVTNIIHCAHA